MTPASPTRRVAATASRKIRRSARSRAAGTRSPRIAPAVDAASARIFGSADSTARISSVRSCAVASLASGLGSHVRSSSSRWRGVGTQASAPSLRALVPSPKPRPPATTGTPATWAARMQSRAPGRRVAIAHDRTRAAGFISARYVSRSVAGTLVPRKVTRRPRYKRCAATIRAGSECESPSAQATTMCSPSSG